jgi:hypothetical protein
MTISIGFSDFWPGFDYRKSNLFNIIQKNFDISISKTPKYLFFSDYGSDHLNFDAVKIRFHGESRRPDFGAADYILGFDYVASERYLRYPLYLEYRDNVYGPELIERRKSEAEIDRIAAQKEKFCCFIVSNGSCDFRNEFFVRLNSIRSVESAGGYMNNIGRRAENKIEFMRPYKFVVAFENSSYPGYTTEKILQPNYSDSVPIYWGSPNVDEEFNPKSFIWVRGKEDIDRVIKQLVYADDNSEFYKNFLRESLFYENTRNHYFSEARVVAFFSRVFSENVSRITKRQRHHRRAQVAAQQFAQRVRGKLGLSR